MRGGFIYCVIFASILSFCSFTGISALSAAEESPADRVIVYYFHGNYRCRNCYNIEKFSEETIGKNFRDELASGRLVFKTVNIEEKGNEHFINDYQLYTKSLVLSLIKNGQEIKSKNLIKVWKYLRNKAKFYQYIKDETANYLKEL